MSTLFWILLFTLVGGGLSVLAAAVFLLLPAPHRTRLLPVLVSFAIGALLGAAFLALLPHALEAPHVRPADIMLVVLLGVLAFFLLEKLVLWRHCHTADCDRHAPGGHRHSAAGHLILVGDAIHNFVDGVLIASAFFVDVQLGMVTGLAVLAHELPQELGDFAILLHSGFTRRKALVYNLLVSLGTVAGGVAGYLFLSAIEHMVPYVLAIAASSFIYIAVADLIPDLHQRIDGRATMQQLVLILAGVGVIYGVDALLH